MTVRRACASLLALLAALNSAIIVVRLVSVVRYARLVPLPIEGPGLYTLWRIRHGWPMYEWPDRDFFSLSLYNGLFYQLYARTLGLAGVADDWTPVAGRFITLAAACAGVWLLYRAIAAASERRLSRVERPGAVLTAFAAAAAFSTGFVLQAKAGSDVNHALEFGSGRRRCAAWPSARSFRPPPRGGGISQRCCCSYRCCCSRARRCRAIVGLP